MDADFIRATSREMQEAMDMTPEEMDRAAHTLLRLQQDREGQDHLDGPMRPPRRALSGAAARDGGNMPLTLALTTALSEVDDQEEEETRVKS